MTTTITIKTHGWPVAVEVQDIHDYTTPQRRGYEHSHTTEFLAAHSEATFYVTDTRSIAFRELPQSAKSLDDDPRLVGQIISYGNSASTAQAADVASGDEANGD